MRHLSPLSSRSSACTRSSDGSPLRRLEESFLALATAPEPLTLPAHLVCEEPEQAALPVDQFRSRLAHPGTSPVLRKRAWCEVVGRAQRLGEPWDTVAIGLTVPVLHRILARLGRPVHLERAELEQEALVAVTAALHGVEAKGADCGRELFAAADRAVHRLVHAAHRRAAREVAPKEAGPGRFVGATDLADASAKSLEAVGGEGGDAYSALTLAVTAHVINVAEARLIARTRLEGEPMQRLATEHGVNMRELYRHRAAAEQQLAAYLRYQLREG
ncbi:hypothetical protein ACFU7T_13075 [Streptomyces sp. NPDC057555]|uniref:hypothetical protein n=1 Tax=Streptomyces sp. NPDC057555 TaxID=3346166 RepID=UPI0036A8BCCA